MKDIELIGYFDNKYDSVVEMIEWVAEIPIENQYIQHPKSLWLIYNYIRRVGVRSTVIKIFSRLREQKRNKKIAGFFIGRIASEISDGVLNFGATVLGLAYNHSSTSRYIVVDKRFLVPLTSGTNGSEQTTLPVAADFLRGIAGWSRFSGQDVNFDEVNTVLCDLAKRINVKKIPQVEIATNYSTSIEKTSLTDTRPSAVLFGLGNYAKVAILPNIANFVNLQRIHEIDAEQIGYLRNRHGLSLDTSAHPPSNDSYEAWFIAGYHHTHTALAIRALEQGAYAVVEKPLATSKAQLNDFTVAVDEVANPRFFLCFHKRYSQITRKFLIDSGNNGGQPVDMHCVVYEIPLPRKHWYNWKNSGSRLISNGCHWIDYFLYVNGYCHPEELRRWRPRGADEVVQIRLENGAFFTMTLTDNGSSRLGVRDYIELRTMGNTFTMIDGSSYRAESGSRIISRMDVNPVSAYARMYYQISRKIAQGLQGDSLQSLLSTAVTLDLEEV